MLYDKMTEMSKTSSIFPEIIIENNGDRDITLDPKADVRRTVALGDDAVNVVKASNTECSGDSCESPSMMKSFVVIAKKFLESFRNNSPGFSSEISPSHTKEQTEEGVLPLGQGASVLKKEKLQIKSVVRRASDSNAIISKSNSPLCSEYYAKNKSNNSSYKFSCKNMNRELANAAGISFYSNKNTGSDRIMYEPWIQPEKHGLENSPRIIPDYYMATYMKNKVLTIDYHYMILDDIRNMRSLNKIQLEYIEKNLNDKQKQEIIVEFNKVVTFFGIANE